MFYVISKHLSFGCFSLNHFFSQLGSMPLATIDTMSSKKNRFLVSVCMWTKIVKKKFHPRSTSSVFYSDDLCWLFAFSDPFHPVSLSHSLAMFPIPTIFQWTSSIFYVIFHSLFYIKNIKTRKRSCSSLLIRPRPLAFLEHICCCLSYTFYSAFIP